MFLRAQGIAFKFIWQAFESYNLSAVLFPLCDFETPPTWGTCLGSISDDQMHVFPRCGQTVGLTQHLPRYSVWAGGFLKRRWPSWM